MASFIHDPDATETFSIDWSRDLMSGETITASSWSVNDATLTLATFSETDGVTSVTVTGGDDGITYSVQNSVTTSAGNTWTRTIFILAQVVL